MSTIKNFIGVAFASAVLTSVAVGFFLRPEHCRGVVLRDLRANAEFAGSVGKYVEPMSFHEVLGGK